MSDARELEVLLAQLSDGSSAEAAAATRQLAALGAAAVTPLLELLDGVSASRGWDALAAIGQPAISPVAQRYWNRPHPLARGEVRLLAQSSEGREVLASAAASSDASVRASAACGLGRTLQSDAPLYLRELLLDPSDEVRSAAALAAGDLRDEASVARLAELASDEHAEVRGSAAWALAHIGTAAALAAFMSTLDDDDITVRLAGIEAVRELRLSEAVPRLLGRLEQADPGIGTGTEINAILDALASLRDPRAESALVRIVDAPFATWRADPKARVYGEHAAEALEALGTPAARAAAARWRGSVNN